MKKGDTKVQQRLDEWVFLENFIPFTPSNVNLNDFSEFFKKTLFNHD